MQARNGLAFAFVGLLTIGAEAQQLKPSPDVRAILAPTGELRVGLYAGNPQSLLQPASGEPRGVGYELGREFARWLGVPFAPVVYPNNGGVLEGLRSGKVDVIFINATAARAKEIDFTQPYMEVEAGFLVPANSAIATAADVDRAGVRVGVMEGSTSSTTLTGVLKNATLVRLPSIGTVTDMLSRRTLDAFATNKAILFEISEMLPGSRVLEGRYGVEQLALGIPKGRELGLPYARTFIAAAVSGGLVNSSVQRAGLRGIVVQPDGR